MSAERIGRKKPHTLRNVLMGAAAAGMAMGAVDGFRTVLVDHRTNTHHSTTPHPRLRQALEFTGRSIGIRDPRLWPDAHLEHHAFSDVRLFPFLKISRAINWVEEQKLAGNVIDIEIPIHFRHLSPKVDKLTQAQVREIGGMAEDQVREKLGKLYVPPTDYTRDELEKLFNPTGPDYYYGKYKKKRRGEYSSDEMAALVLGDPHSPLYADKRGRNGVKQILQWGIWPYFNRTALSAAHPEIISPHARSAGEPKKALPAVATGVLLPGVAVLLGRRLMNRKLEPKDFRYAAAASAVATATRFGFVAAGSMAVNSWGHSGDEVTPGSMFQAATQSEFDIKVRPGGSVASDLQPRGPLTWLIHFFTQDEVFGQGHHHDKPGDRKYTDKDGFQGVIEAPVGSAIDAVVRSRSTLIQPGDNFGLQPGERRPDEPHPATLLIMAARDLQRQQDEARAGEQPKPKRRRGWTIFGRKLIDK